VASAFFSFNQPSPPPRRVAAKREGDEVNQCDALGNFPSKNLNDPVRQHLSLPSPGTGDDLRFSSIVPIASSWAAM
jgi:hypothetical protein